jgi:hypothetical protein
MQFYVTRGGQQLGPFSSDQLRAQLLSGIFHATDLAWHEGAAAWAPLDSYPAIVGPTHPYQSQSGPPPFVPGSQPESSGLAIASMVLGILSFFTAGITAIPAVICGHVAMFRANKSAGQTSGNGFAVAGLITGYLGFLILATVGLGVALPAFAGVQDRAQSTKCLAEAKQIGVACRLYAMDHHGQFPPTLDPLVPDYLPDNHFFDCPLRKNQPRSGYNYFGGKDTDSPAKVLLSSKAVTHDQKRIIVTSDGSAALKRDP